MAEDRLNLAQRAVVDHVNVICSDSPWACRWLHQALNASQVWDNCVDQNDKPNPDQADGVFMALITEWPMNPWFNANKAILVPVMVNAISAWRFSDSDKRARQRAYDVGTELICTTAYLLGGQALVDKHLPDVRRLCLEAQLANDRLEVA